VFLVRNLKLAAVGVLTIVLLGAMGLAQQSVTVTVSQALYLDCSASAAINYSVDQTDIEASQPITIGGWDCNVDALSAYSLSADMTVSAMGITGVDKADFSEDCDAALSTFNSTTGACGAGGNFGPITLATGDNTSGSLGDNPVGNVYVDLSSWDATAGGSASGTITYTVSDTTP